MLQLLLFMVLTLIVFGECIVIGDIDIECSGCGCDRCGMGDVLGMCGASYIALVTRMYLLS